MIKMALMFDNVLLVFVFGFQNSYVGSWDRLRNHINMYGTYGQEQPAEKTALITPDGNTADQTVLLVKWMKYSGNMTKV